MGEDEVRVLLADADEPFLEIMQSYLWDCGHEAEIAADGLECITILREFVPDVLVLDGELLWGGCDGVVEHMRDNHLLCRIPIILIADTVREFYRPAYAQVSARLRKPFRLSDLLDQLVSASRSAPLANQY
jgi:CheY-like chemotaxis protein